MNDNGITLGIVIGMAVAFLVTFHADNAYWHSQMVKHGYAEYNATNGNWQWKESGK